MWQKTSANAKPISEYFCIKWH